MGRILAIDYGEKRIGLALSDLEGKIAFEFEIWSPKEFKQKIAKLVVEKEVSEIVLGHPLNMSGEETKKTQEVLEFKQKLQDLTDMSVELVDERLSSKVASGMFGSNKGIDALAAQVILQHYIDMKNKGN
jgi:putative holliday junction resolvase